MGRLLFDEIPQVGIYRRETGAAVPLGWYNTRLREKSDTLSPKLIFRIAHAEPVGSKAEAENPGRSQLECWKAGLATNGDLHGGGSVAGGVCRRILSNLSS